MKRFHVHVAVNDFADNVSFYSGLFGAEPAILKNDYAKWALDDPRVNFAISTHCEPCFKFHFDRARKLGVSREDTGRAIATAQAVKETPTRAMMALVERLLNLGKVSQPATSAAETASCCSAEKPSSASPASNGATSASCCGGGSERATESTSGITAATATFCGPDKASDTTAPVKSAAGKCC